MIGNVSQSLVSVQRFISASAYFLGILFIMTGVMKLRGLSHSREHSSSKERMMGPTMYLFFGSMLLFLPTAIDMASTTAFGTDNILRYSVYKKFDIYNSMGIVIKTAGLIWFVRGCVLLAHSSESGAEDGPKGLAFLCAGIFAVNFQSTIGILNYFMTKLLNFTLSVG